MATCVTVNGRAAHMQDQLANRCYKLAAGTYVCLLGVSLFILSSPPGKLGIYITMSALGLAAYFLGKGLKRGLAVLLVVTAMCLSVVEYKRGQQLHQKLHDIGQSAR